MARKRVYEVVNNNPNKKSLTLGKQEFRYKNNLFTIEDESIGKELKRQYDGFDAVVNEVEMDTNTEPGHRYFFSGFAELKNRVRVQDDPNWYEYAPGRWRRIYEKRANAGGKPEVNNGEESETRQR